MRLTRPGGQVSLVGMPGARSSLDLTALWHKELEFAGTYAYGAEEYRGERTSSFELAIGIAPEIKLETMVGPHYRLEEYREAIAAARSSGREGHVKVVFDHRAVSRQPGRLVAYPARGRVSRSMEATRRKPAGPRSGV